MAQQHTPAPLSEDSISHARMMWGKVVTAAKYSIIGIIAVLVLMALFLL